MAAKNRECMCCGTKYAYCYNCSDTKLEPTWKSEFCSEDCMTLWSTATQYNLNKITKVEAQSIISEIALKPVEQYSKCVQRDIENIFAEELESECETEMLDACEDNIEIEDDEYEVIETKED